MRPREARELRAAAAVVACMAWVKEITTAFTELLVPFNGDYKFAHKRTPADAQAHTDRVGERERN